MPNPKSKKSPPEAAVPATEMVPVPATPQGLSPVAGLTDEQWNLAKRVMAPGSTDDEFMLFKHWCVEQGYDPLLKQAYFTVQKSKCQECKADAKLIPTCRNGCDKGWFRVPVFMASIDGLIARASRDPNFIAVDGAAVHQKDEFVFDALENRPVKHQFGGERGALLGAWSRVRRKDGEQISFYYPKSEYSGGMVASSKPGIMLLKAAQAILLRRVYPEKNPNTYIPEEFGGYVTEAGTLVLPEASPVKQLAAPAEEQFAHANRADDDPWEEVAEMAKATEKKLSTSQETAAPKDPPATTQTAAPSPQPTPATAPKAASGTPPATAPAGKSPSQSTVHKDTEGHELDENGEYLEGVLRYRLHENVRQVWLESGGRGNWVPAREPLTKFLKSNQIEKLGAAMLGERAYFKNQIEMGRSLEKHFKVGTLASLTGEQLAALTAFKERQLPDPRWYAQEHAKLQADISGEPPIDEGDAPAEEAVEELPQNTPAVTPEGAAKRRMTLRLLFGIKDPATALGTRFLDGLARLPAPEALHNKFKAHGWKWGGGRDEEMCGLVEMLAEGGIELGDLDEMLKVTE